MSKIDMTGDEALILAKKNTQEVVRGHGFIQGKSAYEIAVENGYTGTEQEWLASLQGQEGPQGEPGEKGEKGDKGDPGASGDYMELDNKPQINGVELDGNMRWEDLNAGSSILKDWTFEVEEKNYDLPTSDAVRKAIDEKSSVQFTYDSNTETVTVTI